MKISIFGLGYVGCVTAACLAKSGHYVYGVDINQDKVNMLNDGRSPVVEEGLEQIIVEGKNTGKLQATTDALEAVCNTDISLICVGTPSNSNGSLSLDGIKAVSQQIGKALDKKGAYHCIVVRSTVLPGTVRNEIIPILTRASKREVHKYFDVCFNPEFLREGSSISDFYKPPFTVIGQETVKGGEMVAALYECVDAPVEKVSYEVAEMVKYTCNAFHALKVGFANEIGVLCKGIGIDSHDVMNLMVRDTKLNISAAYLKPGFAFGGSCLPKDLRALLYKCKELDIDAPLLSSVMPSNRVHIDRAIERVLRLKKRKVGILGMSFKGGTDDLRESPFVILIEVLIGKGCQLKIYDSDVALAKIFGANKIYIEKEIPHISSLMCSDIEEVIRDSDVIVVSKPDKHYIAALTPFMKEKDILDLGRINPVPSLISENYEGICW